MHTARMYRNGCSGTPPKIHEGKSLRNFDDRQIIQVNTCRIERQHECKAKGKYPFRPLDRTIWYIRLHANRQRTAYVNSFFATICRYLGVKVLTTTAYHPQTDGRVERYKKTTIARLRRYVANHQRNWDTFVKPLNYADKRYVYWSTDTSPYSFVFSCLPSRTSLLRAQIDRQHPTQPEIHNNKYVSCSSRHIRTSKQDG